MGFTGASPFPYEMTPLTNTAPFTYRDGSTYLEVLSTIERWLKNTLVPDVNNGFANAIAEFQEGIANAETRVVESEEMHNALISDALTSVAASVANNEVFMNTKVGENKDYVDAKVTMWQNSFNTFMANVQAELEALNDTAMGGLISNLTSATSTALVARFAGATRSGNPAVGRNELILNVKDYGVKGDAVRKSSGGAITTGTDIFTGTGFTSADVGKYFAVVGAGASGATLITTIKSFTSATQIVLNNVASTTVANAAYLYGTDDTDAIQAIIDNNTHDASSNVQFFFPKGNYLTGSLRVKNNTQLIGAGRGGWAYEFYDRATRLIAKPGLSEAGLIVDATGQQVGNVRITDMMLDGAKAFHATAKTGIYLSDSPIGADALWSLERVMVSFFSGDGIYLGAFRRANRINDCYFWQNAGNGARFDGTDNNIMQSMFAQNGLDGILINQGANHFYACDIFTNTKNGVKINPFGRMSQFTGCFIDTNGECGVWNQAKNLALTQCRFTSNSQSADGVYPDVDIIAGVQGCAIINPTFYSIGGPNLPHSGVRASGNNEANLVYMVGFSHDPTVTTWRSGSYVEVSFGLMHKGFSFADGSVLTTGSTAGTRFGSSATNKLAFYGNVPIVRPTSPATATDAATTQSGFNDLLIKLKSLGLLT